MKKTKIVMVISQRSWYNLFVPWCNANAEGYYVNIKFHMRQSARNSGDVKRLAVKRSASLPCGIDPVALPYSVANTDIRQCSSVREKVLSIAGSFGQHCGQCVKGEEV